MSKTDPQQRFTTAATAASDPAPPFEGRAAEPGAQHPGPLFGLLAGVPLGAAALAVGCWLADYGDYAWGAAPYGAAGGLLGGAAIGQLERALRGRFVKP